MVDTFAMTQPLDIDLEGACRAELMLNADQIRAEVEGSSRLVLSGQANYLNLLTTGSSKAYAEKMVTKDVAVESHGSTVNYVQALEKLDINLHGSNEVKYKGQPSMRMETNGHSVIEGLE